MWYIGCMLMAELISVLQMAIGPVVLISGVGLLILSLTNRLGRVIDRGRTLAAEMRDANEPKHPKITDQLHILSLRSDLSRKLADRKVSHIQFNVVHPDTLRAARREPDKYRELVVKVSGFNAYLVNLTKPVQDTIIARTLNSL
jgi:hypothetical protein